MFVAVKCRTPDWFENGDHAVIELDEDLILLLDKRVAHAKRSWDEDFYGIKWWDYEPQFLTLTAEDAEMDEQDFDAALESNYFIRLPDSFDPAKFECSRMSPITQTVCHHKQIAGLHRIGKGSFYWVGTEKHSGARVETYELSADVIDEWAELIGCTETLEKVRRLRGAV
jgi:hypothetical protein